MIGFSKRAGWRRKAATSSFAAWAAIPTIPPRHRDFLDGYDECAAPLVSWDGYLRKLNGG